jgi:hypothetical protein
MGLADGIPRGITRRTNCINLIVYSTEFVDLVFTSSAVSTANILAVDFNPPFLPEEPSFSNLQMGFHPMPRFTFFYSLVIVFYCVRENVSLSYRKKSKHLTEGKA